MTTSRSESTTLFGMTREEIDSRIAVVRRSHQLIPGGSPEAIQARDKYIRQHMDCSIGYRLHVPTKEDRAAMQRMRNRGATIYRIAQSLGFDKRTVAKYTEAVAESA